MSTNEGAHDPKTELPTRMRFPRVIVGNLKLGLYVDELFRGGSNSLPLTGSSS